MSLANKEAMVMAIAKEIEITPTRDPDEIIETIYFGGGTPSLLSEQDLGNIFQAVQKKFMVSRDAEITLEANPDDINPALLAAWKIMGINRLSVGLQSFNEKELKWMNRAHNAAQSLQCLDDIAAAGFAEFSVDLIYGSPLQTDEDLQKNFEIIATRNVPHISCYALTVEEGTALNKLIKEGRTAAPDAGKQSDQFQLLLQLMESAGYEQYEISNFCKPGHRSKHNSSYWQGKPYYGFGPAAHSFDGNKVRKWNVSNNSLYLQSIEKNIIPSEQEILTDAQRPNELIRLSLRTAEGLQLELVQQKFGETQKVRLEKDAMPFLANGRMIKMGTALILTKEGKFFADGIAAEMFV
ncbi:MAG: radical SAM family heme chaperone HemW [Ferruginibacter sp.]